MKRTHTRKNDRSGGGRQLGPAIADRAPGRAKTAAKVRRRAQNRDGDSLFLYGLHTVRAALVNPARKKTKLYATQNALSRLGAAATSADVETEIAKPARLDEMVSRDAVHQGAILQCEALEPLDASELFHLADAKLLLALDQITDPHNVGAILRSAVAFDVDAVLMTARNSAVEGAVMAKAASGALDMVRIVALRNLSKGLEELNTMGFRSIGLDSEAPHALEKVVGEAGGADGVVGTGTAIVLGSEGTGLREKTRLTCARLARLDMPGEIKSLNVSNAAALALYVVSRR